jgi:hypothetical protein
LKTTPSGAGPRAGGIGGPVWASKIELEPVSPAPSDKFVDIRTFTVEVDVVATGEIGKSAKLIAEASGGDFGGKTPRDEVSLATRAFKVGAGGEDVAKVQLYLSQLLSTDGGGCFRPNPYKGRTGAAVADGSYGALLRKALARFIVTYSLWDDWKADSVAVTDKNGKSEMSVNREDFVNVFTPDLETGTGTYYPIVDRALLDEIIHFYRLPYVVPQVIVKVEEPSLKPRGSLPVQVLVAGKGNDASRSLILPAPASDRVYLKVSVPDAGNIPGDLTVFLEVPEDSAYRVAEAVDVSTDGVVSLTKPLSELPGRWMLVPSGNVTTDKEDNTFSIRTADFVVLGQVVLGGSRELTPQTKGFGRDAAVLQMCLSQIEDPDDPGKGLLKGTSPKGPVVDGNWGKASADALALFEARCVDEADMDYGRVVGKLADEGAGV